MNFQNFLHTLPIMLYGMLGIFIVTLLVFILVRVLDLIFGRPKKDNNA